MVLPTTTHHAGVSTGEFPRSLPNDVITYPSTTTTHSNIIITELPADIPDGMTHDHSPRLLQKNHQHSRSNQNLALPTPDHMIPERKSSLNAKPTSSPVLTPGKLKEIASAPSTLTKAKTEAKGGEVYVWI